MRDESYVYKKEVDWSLLMEGLTLPVGNQVVLGRLWGGSCGAVNRKRYTST